MLIMGCPIVNKKHYLINDHLRSHNPAELDGCILIISMAIVPNIMPSYPRFLLTLKIAISLLLDISSAEIQFISIGLNQNFPFDSFCGYTYLKSRSEYTELLSTGTLNLVLIVLLPVLSWACSSVFCTQKQPTPQLRRSLFYSPWSITQC